MTKLGFDPAAIAKKLNKQEWVECPYDALCEERSVYIGKNLDPFLTQEEWALSTASARKKRDEWNKWWASATRVAEKFDFGLEDGSAFGGSDDDLWAYQVRLKHG